MSSIHFRGAAMVEIAQEQSKYQEALSTLDEEPDPVKLDAIVALDLNAFTLLEVGRIVHVISSAPGGSAKVPPASREKVQIILKRVRAKVGQAGELSVLGKTLHSKAFAFISGR
eukprot:6486582-Amphidinium_carterae.1